LSLHELKETYRYQEPEEEPRSLQYISHLQIHMNFTIQYNAKLQHHTQLKGGFFAEAHGEVPCTVKGSGKAHFCLNWQSL